MKTKNFNRLTVFMLTLILALIGLSSTSVYADGGYIEEKKEPEKEIKIIKEEKKDIEIRYPNKLEPKSPPKNQNSQNSEKNITPITGIRTEQSNARATVIENVNNANKDYPIYHGIEKLNDLTKNDSSDTETENKETNVDTSLEDKYAADARQFITFQTKNGHTFHLIINHDEKSENVMLLTEVSEDDLLNMVDIKEKKEVVKKVEETPVKEEPIKKEKENTSTYIIVFLSLGLAIIGGYYFKTHKKKEDDELLSFEEPDDNFISEAEETDEANEELDDDELL